MKDYDYEDDNYSDEDNNEEKDNEFVDEFGAHERAGNKNSLISDFASSYDLKKKTQDDLEPEQRFRLEIHKFLKKVDLIENINNTDINNIKEYVIKIDHIEYKNPIAFICAYFMYFKKYTVDNIYKKISTDEASNYLTKEDIIRYYRLIESIPSF